MEPNQVDDVNRSLGRLEGGVQQLLKEMQDLRSDFVDHKGDDRNNFQIVSSRFADVGNKIDSQNVSRAESFDHLEKQLKVINSYIDKIKGAWWLITLMVVVVGGAGAAIAWVVGLLKR